MPSAEYYALAVFAIVFGGFMNGTTNVPMRRNAPLIIRILHQDPNNGWAWENAWFFYSFWTVILTMIWTFSFIPPSELGKIYDESPLSSILLVVLFSLLWGLGTRNILFQVFF